MTRFYIVKDGTIQASAATKPAALDLVRQYQEAEPAHWIQAEYSILTVEAEEFIPYPQKAGRAVSRESRN